VGLFADAGGKDADHALVPIGVEQRQSPGEPFQIKGHGGQQVLGLGFHVLFNGSAFSVEGVQLAGQSQGFVLAVCQQAGDADAHVIQSPGGVEPGADDKTEVGRANLLVIPAGHFQQRQDARPGFALAYPPQALLDKNPVVVVQGNNVGDGAQSHQVQQTAQVGLWLRQLVIFTQVFAQRRQHIKHDANAGGVLAQEGAVGLVGVHDGIGVGQCFSGQVVIGD
jgi:hypothetical protein